MALTNEEFGGLFRSFQHTAFRLELQRQYLEPGEDVTVARYLAGDPEPVPELAWGKEWLSLVRDLTAAGKRMDRVRVHDDPPTDYQRWERWAGQWNIAAGETIRYLTRQRALEIGLLPAAGDIDWWLFDSTFLVEMRFDGDGHRILTQKVNDPKAVVQACAWRDLAVHYSAPDTVQGAAA